MEFKRITQQKLLVKMQPKEKITKGGIELPHSTELAYEVGEIVMVGEDRILDNGTVVPSIFSEGEKVAFVGNTIDFGDDLRVIGEGAVVAVLS